MNTKPDNIERRSRDTRPLPAWRGAHPATACKAATLLFALALPALAQDPATDAPSARFPGEGFELRVYQDAEQAIPAKIFSIPGDGRHPDPPPGGAFRASCNVFHAIDLQFLRSDYCAVWDQDPAAAVATRRALIQRVSTNLPKHGRIAALTSPAVDHPPLWLCGAHIPFPGIVSKIHRPMASAHESPSYDTPDLGEPVPAEPRPPEPPVEIRIHRRAGAATP